MKKLAVIGVDGMDWDLVRQYEEALPNIGRMLRQSRYPRLRSVFPADTTPAWASIYTGLDPSQHGILNFINAGDKKNAYTPLRFDDSAFRGRAFWDRLNEAGLRCAVILPMNIKEGWAINGLMITRPHEGKIHVWPEDRYDMYKPRADILGTEGKFTSEKRLKRLLNEYIGKAEEEFRLAKRALETEDWDVLFAYFSVLDGVQHDFWRHCDTTHPEYPGDNAYRNVIFEMYRRIDGYIGEILALLPETPVLVVSDHGHGMRPVYIVRINELLRRFGYLAPRQKAEHRQRSSQIKRWAKKAAVTFIKRHGLPKQLIKLAKKHPVWKNVFASGDDFDWEHTTAYLSDLSALKNYSYGGLRLSGVDGDKTAVCDELIAKLKAVRIDSIDQPLFLWIKRADALYHGPHLSKYPEVIFQMNERYGAEWSLGDKVFEKQGFMHRLSPGAHRYETAVIAANGFTLDKQQYELTDICPMILNMALAGT
jgi:predicted AlkP superfamily phosphohydrolase/phosphomutase